MKKSMVLIAKVKGLILVWAIQLRVGLNSPCGSFPTQSSLWFCEKFFAVRVVSRWNRLIREIVNDTSLGVFKVRLDGALTNLV